MQIDDLAATDVLHQLATQVQHAIVVGDAAVHDGAVVERQIFAVHHRDRVVRQLEVAVFVLHNLFHVFEVWP
jgi:hypothetical protein